MPRKVGYSIGNLGEVIKEERERQGMSQQDLADLVGVSRTMVVKMERDNHGLNSVQTRRDVARALGISPLVLGVGSTADVKAEPIYNTNILRMTLNLHREAYYTTGNFGLPAIHTMVSEIEGILKEKNNPKDILEIYAEYNALGILIGKEEMNLVETSRYIEEALDATRSLNNPALHGNTLAMAACAMYYFGNLSEAAKYALEAAALRKIPNHLRAHVQTTVAVATGDTNAIKLAKQLVLSPNDYPSIKLDSSYCMFYNGYVLIDAGKFNEALEELITAEEETPGNLKRRHCVIQALQAECLLATKQYDEADLVAETAMTLANEINSKPNLVRLRRITRALKKRTGQ